MHGRCKGTNATGGPASRCRPSRKARPTAGCEGWRPNSRRGGMPGEAPAPCAEAPELEGRWLAVGGTVLAVGAGALRPPCDPKDGPASAGAVVAGDTPGESSCDPRDPAYAIPASARAAATAIE